MDSISSTLSRAPAASSSVKKSTTSQPEASPTKTVKSVQAAILELIKSAEAAGHADCGTVAGRLIWSALDKFQASPNCQNDVFDVQAYLLGAQRQGDATSGQVAIITTVLPLIDQYADQLDGAVQQPTPKSDEQKLHDITGVRLAADVIQQGEKLQGSDGSFFMRKYRPAGNQLNNYALNAIKLVIAHPEIAGGFAAALSGYLAYEGGTPDVDICFLQAKHEEIFGPGTWSGEEGEPDRPTKEDAVFAAALAAGWVETAMETLQCKLAELNDPMAYGVRTLLRVAKAAIQRFQEALPGDGDEYDEATRELKIAHEVLDRLNDNVDEHVLHACDLCLDKAKEYLDNSYEQALHLPR